MIAGLFILCVVAAVSAAQQSCKEATKVPIDTVKVLSDGEPQWLMVRSSEPNQKCITFQYLAYREGNKTVGTAIYRDVKTNDWHSARKSEGDADKSWTCTHEDYPTVVYYASFATNDAFCLYSCDVKTDTVDYIACFVRQAKNTEDVDKEIKENNQFYSLKPVSPVWEDCEKPTAQ